MGIFSKELERLLQLVQTDAEESSGLAYQCA